MARRGAGITTAASIETGLPEAFGEADNHPFLVEAHLEDDTLQGGDQHILIATAPHHVDIITPGAQNLLDVSQVLPIFGPHADADYLKVVVGAPPAASSAHARGW